MRRRVRRRNKVELYGWRAVLCGFGISAFSLFAVALTATFVCYLSNDPMAISELASLVSLLIGGAVSGFIFPRLCRDTSIIPTVLSGVIFSLVLLAAGLLLSNGALPLKMLTNMLCYLGVSLLASLLSRRLA